MNEKRGIGVASLSCFYGATVFSSFVAPPVIHQLTTKWTIAAGFMLFVVYFLINFFPHGMMLIPASLLLGLLTGPLWSASSTHLTSLAIRYSQYTQQQHETVINRFISIFTAMHQSSQILGHVITIIVLSHNSKSPKHRYSFQYTHIDRYNGGINRSWHDYHLDCGSHSCGIEDYPSDDIIYHHDIPVTMEIRNILLGIHVAIAFTGLLLVVFFLDKGEVTLLDGKLPMSESSHNRFLSTLHMFCDCKLLLLAPLVFFTGLEQGFMFSDFTKVGLKMLQNYYHP